MGLIPGLGRSPGGGHGNPLPCSLRGESCGQGSLVGYHPWGCRESDVTKGTQHRGKVSLSSVARGEMCPGASFAALQKRVPGPSPSRFSDQQMEWRWCGLEVLGRDQYFRWKVGGSFWDHFSSPSLTGSTLPVLKKRQKS